MIGFPATHVERKPLYMFLALLPDKMAVTANAATARAFARHGDLPREV
ncbi:MAG: hypothetical protein V1918_00345 [Planctomycetota bacterium]